MKNKWLRLVLYIILAYIASGLLYNITNYIYLDAQGEETTFTFGTAKDVLNWPWLVYADLKNNGIKPQDIAAFFPFIQLLLISIFKKKIK